MSKPVKKELRFVKTLAASKIEEDVQYTDLLKKFISSAEIEIRSGHMSKLQSSRLALEVYESKAKLKEKLKHLSELENDFFEAFLPGYNKEVELMKQYWGVTIDMVIAKIKERLGYDFLEPDNAVKSSMYEKALVVLEGSADENLKDLFMFFCQYQTLPADQKENEDIKHAYYKVFLQSLK